MSPLAKAILRHVIESAEISDRYASRCDIEKAVNHSDARYVLNDLWSLKLIEEAPRKPKAPRRFKITDKGRDALKEAA